MFRIGLACLLTSSVFALEAMAQSDCSASLMGQVGCGYGSTPYTTSLGNTLGDRGNGYYTSDPDPNDSTYGAYPYANRMGTATDDIGRPYDSTLSGSGGGCRQTMSGTYRCD